MHSFVGCFQIATSLRMSHLLRLDPIDRLDLIARSPQTIGVPVDVSHYLFSSSDRARCWSIRSCSSFGLRP